MKTISSIASIRTVKAVMAISCLSFYPFQNLQAQSVDVLQSLSNSSQTPASDKPSEPAPDIKLIKSQPSRFAVGNVASYTSAHIAGFYMNDKKMDVFGLFQDPNFRPVIKNTPTTTRKGPTHIAAIPLTEIIKDIKVTTIMFKEKSFLVGDSIYKESEEFSLTTHEGRAKNLKVLKVDPGLIIIKDMDTNEEAPIKINALPPGMETGGEKLKPAGMSSTNEKKHINLENK